MPDGADDGCTDGLERARRRLRRIEHVLAVTGDPQALMDALRDCRSRSDAEHTLAALVGDEDDETISYVLDLRLEMLLPYGRARLVEEADELRRHIDDG